MYINKYRSRIKRLVFCHTLTSESECVSFAKYEYQFRHSKVALAFWKSELRATKSFPSNSIAYFMISVLTSSLGFYQLKFNSTNSIPSCAVDSRTAHTLHLYASKFYSIWIFFGKVLRRLKLIKLQTKWFMRKCARHPQIIVIKCNPGHTSIWLICLCVR